MEIRAYRRDSDYEAVGRMLVQSYRPGRVFDPWLQPRWEYMHFHPLIIGRDLTRFGIAQEAGRVTGVVHFEDDPAVCYLQRRPGCDHVIEPLLDWAAQHLGGPKEPFGDVLAFYVPDFDLQLRAALRGRGFSERAEYREPQSRLTGISRLDRSVAPSGYALRSLADENHLTEVDRILWRGFGHVGPSPPEGIEQRRFMQSAPNFRPDLTIVAIDTAGSYVSLCGTWVLRENAIAVVEPVATDPDHRRKGLGRAVVTEALRRAGTAGAAVAWVGSGQAFYRSLGFEPMFAATLWVKN